MRVLILLALLAACGDNVAPPRPDAAPKYDACDPTISKGCAP